MNRLGLRTKLATGFGLLLALLVFLGGVSYYSLFRVTAATEVANSSLTRKQLATLTEVEVRKQIQAEIRKRLIEKGLSEVTAGQRDLNVRFSLGSARRREVDVYPVGWWGMRRVVTGYTEGTLVIDLRDTSQKSLAWRAIAVEDKSDAAHIESKLGDMVKKSFEQYPPKKK